MARMRICMVSAHASPLTSAQGDDASGQSVHVAALSDALAGRGHSVSVYCRRDARALPERVQLASGVEVIHVEAGPARALPANELLPFMGAFAKAVADDSWHRPADIIHGYSWMSGLAALEAAHAVRSLRSQPAVVETFHHMDTVIHRCEDSGETGQRHWMETAVARRVDQVVATCTDHVDELTSLGVDPRRIRMVSCGVDLTLFSDTVEPEPTSGRRRIAVIGRMVEREGIDLAIRALGLLADQGVEDLELHIVGRSSAEGHFWADPEVLRLRRLAAELGLANRVVFRGRQRHQAMPGLLRSCMAVVCASWDEPFGLVALEAMACAVPTIVAAVGGLQNSVLDGVTGLYVPPGDPEALARALLQLLGDPVSCRRLGQAGRRRVEHSYSWEHIAKLTEDAYRQITFS
ncbi:MAG: glycosyltransferase [Propionicimonas sp.]|nr:glycosyltransferase [Propionicimonas sp.]